jgi:hypothetical protein
VSCDFAPENRLEILIEVLKNNGQNTTDSPGGGVVGFKLSLTDIWG